MKKMMAGLKRPTMPSHPTQLPYRAPEAISSATAVLATHKGVALNLGRVPKGNGDSRDAAFE